ncbi:hypothetical protein EC973_006269 [Apophysomyces ossiformis]|uniref:Uncharacterized protein n=1 Tax=Apophysomyces ossiformis TaxID=679940 RepID=A0A8H7BR96_9FUNG|nr:hypothetical protein EC973_006269 [Apophysomyces ossiformis]
MVIFYFGEILLSILETVHVIKGTDGTHSTDGIAWPAEAVKNGLYVIIICVVMAVVVFLMAKFFGPQDAVTKYHMEGEEEGGRKMSPWMAFVDGYLWYIPMFLYSVLCCGVDSYRLAKKRVELKARKKRGEITMGDTNQHLLQTKAEIPSITEDINHPAYPAPIVQNPSSVPV